MAGTHTTSRPSGIADDTTTSDGGSSKVGELASKGKDAAGAAVGTIKEQGSELQTTAKTKLTGKAEDSRKVAADKARAVESDLRDLVGSVRDKQPQVGDAMEQALDRASSLVEYVETTPVDEMVTDLQRQARQHPWLMVGGMFAAGFLLSRALKPVDGVLGSGPGTGQRQLTSGGGTVSGQLPQSTGTPVHV
jgi:flavin-binding protein dodecin